MYTRERLEHARGTAYAQVAWLESQPNPAVTSYAEAGHVGPGLMPVITDLIYAGHWGAISAIYHHSYDAKSAFELGAQALELANELRARAYRCYVDAYVN